MRWGRNKQVNGRGAHNFTLVGGGNFTAIKRFEEKPERSEKESNEVIAEKVLHVEGLPV